jgi:hypothetical protein
VGSWQRDFDLLFGVVEKIESELANQNIKFDLVIPIKDRQVNALRLLANKESVTFHHDISEESLRNLYWHAAVVILPTISATANNSLLESIATQTPIVINENSVSDFYSKVVWPGVIPVKAAVDCFFNEIVQVFEGLNENKSKVPIESTYMSWENAINEFNKWFISYKN